MAGNVWNPNAPTVVGEEWLADVFGTWDLSSNGPWAQRIRSRSAQTIANLMIWQTATLSPTAGAPLDGQVSGQDVILAEIMPAGSETPGGSVATVTYQPSADQAIGAGWAKQDLGVTNLFATIDETVAAYNTTDWVQIGSGSLSNYDFRVGSSGFSAGRRVVKLQLRMTGWASNSVGDTTVTIGIVHVASGRFYKPNGAQVSLPNGAGSASTTTFDLGEINPDLPWTVADVQGFSSGTYAIRLRAGGTATVVSVQVTAVEMIVSYYATENRVAAASFAPALGATVTPGAFLSTAFEGLPTGTTWAKPASGDFTVLLRRPSAPLMTYSPHNPGIAWASSLVGGVAQDCPVPGVVSAPATLDSNGIVTAVDFAGANKGRTIPLLVRTSAPATSDDSLPYYLASDTTHMPAVNNSQAVTQQFSATASATFNTLKLLLKPGTAIQNLLVKIKRVSDNVQFGSTATLTPASVAALPTEANGLKVVTVAGIGAVLVSGTRYYVELTSTDTKAAGSGWQAVSLGDSTLTGGDAAGFDAATNTILVGGVAAATNDMPFTFASIPNTPAGLSATIRIVVPASFATSQPCDIETVQAVRVAWTATALGATWLRYEIQRTEDFGATWYDIAYGQTLEATVTFDDFESPRGKAVQYRIRVVRTDGVASSYSAATASVTPQPFSCEMIFCSNEQPTYVVAYNREPEMRLNFLSAERDELIEIYGADYAVAFMESEDPGIQTEALLTINFGVNPTDDTVAIWSPLRRLARAAVSYVCVLDWTGSRFFAHLQFPEGDWEEPGYRYHARVVITEITSTPSVAVF
jgi:hypothetical protein